MDGTSNAELVSAVKVANDVIDAVEGRVKKRALLSSESLFGVVGGLFPSPAIVALGWQYDWPWLLTALLLATSSSLGSAAGILLFRGRRQWSAERARKAAEAERRQHGEEMEVIREALEGMRTAVEAVPESERGPLLPSYRTALRRCFDRLALLASFDHVDATPHTGSGKRLLPNGKQELGAKLPLEATREANAAGVQGTAATDRGPVAAGPSALTLARSYPGLLARS